MKIPFHRDDRLKIKIMIGTLPVYIPAFIFGTTE
jgi:hypothetical protein